MINIVSVTLIALMVLLVIWQLYVNYRLKTIYKHDLILYQYCQLRRNIQDFLRVEFLNLTEGKSNISPEEYELISSLEKQVSRTISNFTEYKTKFFNLNMWNQLGQEAVQQDKFAESLLRASKKPQINKLILEYKYCIVSSFLVYTPGLKRKVTAAIALVIFALIIRAGYRSIDMEWFKKQIDWISKREHQYNVYADYGQMKSC